MGDADSGRTGDAGRDGMATGTAPSSTGSDRLMKTMRAVRTHQREGPDRLFHETAPRPEPGRGDVVVAVRAASITTGELAWDATWTDSFDGSGRR